MAFSKEEYIAMGYDEETAELLAVPEGGESGGSPFKKLSMSYSDILADEAEVKKGSFIAGWREDKKVLSVKEVGTNFGNKLDIVFLGEAYQVSQFDTATNTNIFQTKIFSDPFDTKLQKDTKTGVTVEEWKAKGKRAVFNQICLVIAKLPKEKDWEPFLVYLHGTNYYTWRTQIEEQGLRSGIRLKYKFSISSKKVATDYQPAWCFNIDKVAERTGNEIMETVPVTSQALKDFNTWIKKSNTRGADSVDEQKVTTKYINEIADSEDYSEDDIKFSDD